MYLGGLAVSLRGFPDVPSFLIPWNRSLVGKSETVIDRAVNDAFRRYVLEPGEVGKTVAAIRAGEAIPTIKPRVPPSPPGE